MATLTEEMQARKCCAGWVDDGIQGSTGEEEVLGRRLGVELLSIWIKEGAGGREL
ncbi:hypothetical protein TRIUR3_22679 [Triticum urartu]|uniref:Uncharacterized protein n=1 Tax=Triticum urartu TaxID=4572 RepID=M8AIV5_TRIUA|nr:hypothetical protein TRIUR3_22679 [Triticum urartu]